MLLLEEYLLGKDYEQYFTTYQSIEELNVNDPVDKVLIFFYNWRKENLGY